ncbi:unnamed protein product [Lampetra planeri]
MEKVLVSLEEKRKNGTEPGVLTSIKERLANTQGAMDVRDHMASILERQFSALEQTLLNMQFRINKLIQQ